MPSRQCGQGWRFEEKTVEQSPVWKECGQGQVERTFQTEIIVSTEAGGVGVCVLGVVQDQQGGQCGRSRGQRGSRRGQIRRGPVTRQDSGC